jgi:hypothetical protein
MYIFFLLLFSNVFSAPFRSHMHSSTNWRSHQSALIFCTWQRANCSKRNPLSRTADLTSEQAKRTCFSIMNNWNGQITKDRIHEFK